MFSLIQIAIYFKKPPSINSSLISCLVISFCFVSIRIAGTVEFWFVEFEEEIFIKSLLNTVAIGISFSAISTSWVFSPARAPISMMWTSFCESTQLVLPPSRVYYRRSYA